MARRTITLPNRSGGTLPHDGEPMTAPNRHRDADAGPSVRASIEAPGYSTSVTFPLSSDSSDAFATWFQMQVDYLARWKPGSAATIRETEPTKLKAAVCEY